MGIGPFTTHDGLNSFFDGHVDRTETLALLRAHLGQLADNPTGGLSLLVTHQVVITGITGIAPDSGGSSPITATHRRLETGRHPTAGP